MTKNTLLLSEPHCGSGFLPRHSVPTSAKVRESTTEISPTKLRACCIIVSFLSAAGRRECEHRFRLPDR